MLRILRMFYVVLPLWTATISVSAIAQDLEGSSDGSSDGSSEDKISETEQLYWDNVDVYLVTLGRNEVIYTGGGHSLLRVNDKNIRKDRVFNWGTFDFDDPAFVLKFYRGTLLYSMDEMSTSKYFAFTAQYFRREYLQDKLILTAQQKISVMAQIDFWRQPENNKYLYQFYKNNCSTKVRDILNDGMNGAIKEHFDTMIGAKSARGYWRQTFAAWPAAIFFTDLLFNSEVDGTLSKWEEMFVPIMLHKHLKKFHAVSDSGEGQENLPLFSSSQQLLKYTPPEVSPLNGHQWFAIIWGIPLLLAISLFASHRRKIGFRILGLLAITWGVTATIYGIVIPVTSFVSSRIYWHWSVNLLYLWPIDFMFVWAGYYWLKGSVIPQKKLFLNKWLPILTKAHAVGIIFFAVDYLLAISNTDSYLILVYVITLFAIFLSFSHYATKYATQD